MIKQIRYHEVIAGGVRTGRILVGTIIVRTGRILVGTIIVRIENPFQHWSRKGDYIIERNGHREHVSAERVINE